MNNKHLGDISEAMVLAALLKKGYTVLKPWGDNARYDLVIDDGGKFLRIQVKTGRLKKGEAIEFPTYSCPDRTKVRQSYHGEIEFFGVYCPETNECYLVPIPDVNTQCRLRVTPIQTGHRHTRWAANYLL